MTDVRLQSNPVDGITAIYLLLKTGDPYYRAAAILLLRAFCSQLTESGNGELASRLVAAFREHDPLKYHTKDGKLRP